jgi:hypothetical protein
MAQEDRDARRREGKRFDFARTMYRPAQPVEGIKTTLG